MPIRVNLLALEPHAHGYARLVIKGWKGSQQQLEFTLQRNSDDHYLHEGQKWSNNPFWFQVPEFPLAADGKSLEVLVGPQIVDTLLEGSVDTTFSFVLNEPATGTKDHGVVLPGRDVTSRAAGDEKAAPPVWKGIILADVVGSVPAPAAPVEAPPVVVAEPAPEPAPAPAPEPVIEPVAAVVEPVRVEPAPAAPKPAAAGKKKAWLIPLIIALLAIIAAGVFFWLKNPAADTVASPAPTPAPLPTGAEACTLESMSTLPELTFVQICIKKSPGSAELLEIINVAKANNHCGIAQRLYANRAQAGDMQIATAYAHEYDPKFHQASQCFAEPDKATAAYWYETILSHEPENAQAKARFEELKP